MRLAAWLTERAGRVTFEDVAGVDEAKEELQEIVELAAKICETPTALITLIEKCYRVGDTAAIDEDCGKRAVVLQFET